MKRTAALLAGLLLCTLTAACGSGEQPGGAAAAVERGLSITIPSIGVQSSLIPLGLNEDRTVATPPLSTPMQAGLYVNGPAPGDPGPAVVLGHINGGGQEGVFSRLAQVKAGDEVDVAKTDGTTATFTIREVTRAPKDAFPTAKVYSDTPNPQLRLITCGGALDRTARSYVDNVIVYADLTGTRA
ncbi:class F sortase [Actinomycetospora termitidis]|uniref:Class F sortase n=1 Tax=Actinomycetospora termitidis TaxID=3053470 RepID=A0ABT7M608_9PSEU|nr:class F sortase [Actinomycetospora sp. Odt1-22]MDL5156105.1 class F sortase [Actinomycetospora sp. Odt1-22]